MPGRFKLAVSAADKRGMSRHRPPTDLSVSGLARRLRRRAAEGRPRVNPAALDAAAAVAGIPLGERVSAPGKNPASSGLTDPLQERMMAETLRRLALQAMRARARGDWQAAELHAAAWHRVNAARQRNAAAPPVSIAGSRVNKVAGRASEGASR